MILTLNDILAKAGIDPRTTLVVYHLPREPELRRALPMLATQRRDIYIAYESSHSARVAASFKRASHIVTGINREDGTIAFVGVHAIDDHREMSWRQIASLPGFSTLREIAPSFGLEDGETVLDFFEIRETEVMADLSGRLLIERPPGRGYTRWADRHDPRVLAILPENCLADAMPPWQELVLDWAQLPVLPPLWTSRLLEWRGIYLVTDTSDGKEYVGSAGGTENLLGRWREYARTGHGQNRELRGRDPRHFRFSILERVSPDLDRNELVKIENSWKERLLTREHGLNAN